MSQGRQTGSTIYWHDYETFGTDPRRDRPAQFAGLRTDEDLNIVGEPLMLYCRPAGDVLPHPDACLITGITPQLALAKGVPEAAFIGRIHEELSRPGTCGAGYNSIRFDDEFTRNTLYRNFFDPYAREWKNGNSRWDVIDMVRLTRALRPEGIEWPEHADGTPSFRLEDLTAANRLEHGAAHDALSDVSATIALARLIRERQPRLYDYVYGLRSKHEVARLLDLAQMKPVLHVSAMYPARYGCTAMVAPVARHPVNQNGIVVYDLRYDPRPLLALDADELRERLYTPAEDLPAGVDRLPLKTVHLNKCPVIAPPKTIDEAAARRLDMDLQAVEEHLRLLRAAGGLEARIQQVMSGGDFPPEPDPDLALYGGGFFSDADRIAMDRVRACPPERLAALHPVFQDRRLPEMFFRYRARSWPETLSPDERARWDEYREARLTDPEAGGGITIDDFVERTAQLRADPGLTPAQAAVLDALEAYAENLLP